jgi:hypothetical protein
VTDGALVCGAFGRRVGEPTTIKPLVELTLERGGTHLRVEGIDERSHLMVALFGSAELDVRNVDEASLAFGPDGARARLSLPIRLNRDRHKDLLGVLRPGADRSTTRACSGETRGPTSGL